MGTNRRWRRATWWMALTALVTSAAAWPGEGDLDTAFGNDGLVVVQMTRASSGSSWANDIALQPDGKILLVGSAPWNTTGDTDVGIARLLPDGSLDPSFALSGKMYVSYDLGGLGVDAGTAIEVLDDGRFIVGGVSTGESLNYGTMSRHLATGWLDTSFRGTGTRSLALLEVYAVSDRESFDDTDGFTAFGRQLSFEPGFDDTLAIVESGDDGSSSLLTIQNGGGNAQGLAVASDRNGKFLFGGAIGNDCAILRLTEALALDPTFGAGGIVQIAGPDGHTCRVVWIGEDASGGVLAVFGRGTIFGSIRLLPSGELDTDYAGGGFNWLQCPQPFGFFCDGRDAALDAEGRLVIGGDVDAALEVFAARLLPDGTPDPTFSSGLVDGFVFHPMTFSALDEIDAVAVRPDGRILLAGRGFDSGTDTGFAVLQLQGFVGGLVFADGFDRGHLDAWSSIVD